MSPPTAGARSGGGRQRQRGPRTPSAGCFDVVVSDTEVGRLGRPGRAAHDRDDAAGGVGHLMTAFGSVTTAVEAMKHGAFDYVRAGEARRDGSEGREGAGAEAPAQRARLPPQRAPGKLRLRQDRRRQRDAAARARRRPQGGEEQFDGVDSRRNRHRQGADRQRDPSQLAARGAQLRQGELRGAAGEPARIGTVRPRKGRVHRAPTGSASAASNRPTAARCSSTRSAT